MADMTHLRSVSLLIWPSIVLLALPSRNQAITSEDKSALLTLISIFPQLSSIPRAALQTYQPPIGGPWNDIKNTCSGEDGWYIHGVYCKGGRINSLFMFVLFLAFNLPLPPFNPTISN